MVMKTPAGHAIPGPVEIAYPLSLAQLSDQEPRVREINRDIFSAACGQASTGRSPAPRRSSTAT
jgi:hypothetical protein